MIRLVPTTTADEAIKDLYEAAFPEVERRPWPLQVPLIASGELQLLRIMRGDAFAGFIFYWKLPAFSFIEHFAIHPGARGGGTGTQVMESMEKELGAIVLEVEPPVTEQAIRRVNFYERLGYQTFPEIYLQPSYYPQLPPLQLCLMHKGLPVAMAHFTDIRDTLYTYVYKK